MTNSSENSNRSFSPSNKQISSESSWRIFRIMAEMIDGFDFLSQFNKSVTIFGSAKTQEGDQHYDQARQLARLLTTDGFTLVTGGGPGIMEAANRGAVEGGGQSVGLNIVLPEGERRNKYVQKAIAFNYFFTRKVMLSFAAQAYVFFPGGFGTLDEFFEMVTLIQTRKIEENIPIVCVGLDYWSGLVEWLKKTVSTEHRAIDEGEINLFQITDEINQALTIIRQCQPRQMLSY